MIGIGQFVVDDLGENAVAPCESVEFIQLLQTQHRRLFDQDVLAGFKSQSRRVEMPVVRRGDANGVYVLGQQLRDSVRPGATNERAERGLTQAFGSAPVRLATAVSSTSTEPKSRR